MRKSFRRRIIRTADAMVLSVVACTCIYGVLLVATAKSMMRMQTSRVDL